jgi:hypothetical protein
MWEYMRNIVCAWNVGHSLFLWGRIYVVSRTVSAEVDCRTWDVAEYCLNVFRVRAVHKQGLLEGVGKRRSCVT